MQDIIRKTEIKKRADLSKKNSLAQKLVNFIKYNNGFVIGLLGVFILMGSVLAASPDAREVITGRPEAKNIKEGIDSQNLLAINFDEFDPQIEITNAMEDEINYYITYQYTSLAIQDDKWQETKKENILKIEKSALGEQDLGNYVAKELSEVAAREIAYLKKVQKNEQAKTLTLKTTKYGGLIGASLNKTAGKLSGYEPKEGKRINNSRQEVEEVRKNIGKTGERSFWEESGNDAENSQENQDSQVAAPETDSGQNTAADNSLEDNLSEKPNNSEDGNFQQGGEMKETEETNKGKKQGEEGLSEEKNEEEEKGGEMKNEGNEEDKEEQHKEEPEDNEQNNEQENIIEKSETEGEGDLIDQAIKILKERELEVELDL